MKIIIKRAFSSKKQIAQYEPIESFCGAEAEIEIDSPLDTGKEVKNLRDIRVITRQLDDFCRTEVEKTIAEVKMANLPKGRSKEELKDVSKNEAELDLGASVEV